MSMNLSNYAATVPKGDAAITWQPDREMLQTVKGRRMSVRQDVQRSQKSLFTQNKSSLNACVE